MQSALLGNNVHTEHWML